MSQRPPDWLPRWGERLVATAAPLIRAELLDTVRDTPPEHVVALGVYTDVDASSVVAVACTRTHLETLQAEDPDFSAYYRWSTQEWDLGAGDGPSPLDPVSDELRRTGDRVPEEAFWAFKMTAWSSLVDAMGTLRDEGFFDAWSEAVRVFAAVEAGIEPEVELRWIARLNTDEDAAAFAACLAAEADPS